MSRHEPKITSKGTELPLIDLKGKPYLQVAHRLVWLVEDVTNYSVVTEFLKLEVDHAVARASITLLNAQGQTIKTATATKRETKSDFPDFVEKAETGAIGRALAILGFGTQFSTQDLDEGTRLADAPTAVAKKGTNEVQRNNPSKPSVEKTSSALAPAKAVSREALLKQITQLGEIAKAKRVASGDELLNKLKSYGVARKEELTDEQAMTFVRELETLIS